MLHDILPVGVKLLSILIPVSGCCQVCSYDGETAIHFLFECAFSKQIWSLLVLTSQSRCRLLMKVIKLGGISLFNWLVFME